MDLVRNRFHLMLYGPCQTSLYTLVTLGTDTAFKTACGFSSYHLFIHPGLDFFKTSCSIIRRKTRHLFSFNRRDITDIHVQKRFRFFRSFLFQVLAF